MINIDNSGDDNTHDKAAFAPILSEENTVNFLLFINCCIYHFILLILIFSMSDLRFYKLLKFFSVKALIYTFKTCLKRVTLTHIVRVDKNKTITFMGWRLNFFKLCKDLSMGKSFELITIM